MELSFAFIQTFLFSILTSAVGQSTPAPHAVLPYDLVEAWANRLGYELWKFGEYVTRMKDVQESYKAATVEEREGEQLLNDIAQDIQDMMLLKISAVRRIMDTAQTAAFSAEEKEDPDFQYYDAKLLVNDDEPLPEGGRHLKLTPNKHFSNIPVNTSVSAVHIPTNVYGGSEDVMHAIKWSQTLDSIFTDNYRKDPSLSWQYFGSSTGFMRQYPAMQWKQEPVDLYDCRTRSWYIEAAASPKDIMILVDRSGSMTGMRKEIARHVVNNILDTLGNNDYVNIFTFSDTTTEVVKCFKDGLVQANLANIREFKMAMEDIETTMIANFSLALTRAFEVLELYRSARLGACCNQAIMLVTDGVPYNFKSIFEQHNWANIQNDGFMPVRVFTYLIGREVADVKEVKWMACENKGYYVHLSTLAEVREQVLHYIPVMARPLVLQETVHPIVWTPVYADVTDPKMTDWLWEVKECAEQKERFQSYRKNKLKFQSKEEQDRRFVKKLKRTQDQHGDLQEYQLMTSVSMPVYDLRKNANITERVLVNEAFWVTKTRETRVANLLGVAGTDVPIQEIQRLTTPHKLGVNGYAFLVTNNGHILVHPDLRPVFQGILKPNYNSVDIAEVELVDDGREPRELDKLMILLRDSLFDPGNGSFNFKAKYHYDGMKRVGLVQRVYFYKPVLNFSLVVVVPAPYGLYQVHSELEVHRMHIEGKHNILDYFKGKNWKVHPDWDYCRYHYDSEHSFDSPEEELYHFLNKTRQTGWKWLTKRNFSPPEHASNASGVQFGKDSYFCDRELFQSLAMDAKITEWYNNNISEPTDPSESGKEYQARYGFCVAFVATHSGLTRWIDFHANPDKAHDDMHFSEIHNRAIDEIWYKRAVEQYEENNTSFVYSVPHSESGYRNGTLVTASHAIFHTSPDKRIKAPAAVVGFQVQHSALHSLFINITSSTPSGMPPKPKCTDSCRTCASDDVDCYVLDNHGYIIVSENLAETGRFFGEIRGTTMRQMVAHKVYRQIEIYDYQAVCFRADDIPSDAPSARTPAQHVRSLFHWITGSVLWSAVQAILSSSKLASAYMQDEGTPFYAENYDMPEHNPPNGGPIGEKSPKVTMEQAFAKLLINRTRPQPCDQQLSLFLLTNGSEVEGASPRAKGIHLAADKCDTRAYVAHSVPNSNLLLVAVDALCPIAEYPISLVPQEVDYNESLSCYKVHNWDMNRKRSRVCYNHHYLEKDIKLCGRAGRLQESYLLCLVLLLAIFLVSHLLVGSFKTRVFNL